MRFSRSVRSPGSPNAAAIAWSLDDDHYRADWDNGPKNSCTKVIKTPEAVLVIDAATGQPRGTIAKIVPNAEGL